MVVFDAISVLVEVIVGFGGNVGVSVASTKGVLVDVEDDVGV